MPSRPKIHIESSDNFCSGCLTRFLGSGDPVCDSYGIEGALLDDVESSYGSRSGSCSAIFPSPSIDADWARRIFAGGGGSDTLDAHDCGRFSCIGGRPVINDGMVGNFGGAFALGTVAMGIALDFGFPTVPSKGKEALCDGRWGHTISFPGDGGAARGVGGVAWVDLFLAIAFCSQLFCATSVNGGGIF